MLNNNNWKNDEQKNNERKRIIEKYTVINGEGSIQHVNCKNLADLIINETNYYFLTIEDEEGTKREIFYYKDGLYHRGGEFRIRELVDYYVDHLSTLHRKNEVTDFIKNYKHAKRKNMEPPLHLINLKNGIYDIKNKKLLNHTPDYYFINQLPVEYDEDADCPCIKKFFEDVLYPEYIPVMQEMIGYCLYRKYIFHKAFLLYGGGRNGKGTTVDIIAAFLGDDNYSTRKLHDLVENRFSKANLYGKLACLGSEISGRALVDTGDFKHLTGGEPIPAEVKNGPMFNFRNYAKLIFNANHIPYSKYDKSYAFFQRWIIFVYPETFELGNPKTDINILDKLTTKKEMSGLFNWAVEGLLRLLKNKKFSYTETEEEAGERYELLAKPDMRFILERLEFVEGHILTKNEVYDKYEEWARKRKYPVLPITSFTRSIKKYIHSGDKTICADVTTTKRNGIQVKGYKNLNWRIEFIESMRLHSPLSEFDIPTQNVLMSKDEKAEHAEKMYG